MDIKAKRLNVMAAKRKIARPLPEPDGSIDTVDRYHFLGLYNPTTSATPPSFGGDDLTSLNLGRLMRIGV